MDMPYSFMTLLSRNFTPNVRATTFLDRTVRLPEHRPPG
jgi:hypothetical protein